MLRQQLEEEERKAIGQAKGEEMRSSAPPHQGAGTSKAAGGSGAPSSYVQLRECVENHLIRVPFVRTDANDADFFTKVLPARKFFPLRDKIMNVPSHLRWDAASAPPSRDS